MVVVLLFVHKEIYRKIDKLHPTKLQMDYICKYIDDVQEYIEQKVGFYELLKYHNRHKYNDIEFAQWWNNQFKNGRKIQA
jgi:hypothetical protein